MHHIDGVFFHFGKNATGGGCNTIEKMENRSRD